MYVRQRLVEEGLERALGRKKQQRPSRARLLDGEKEAQLIALRLRPASWRASPLDAATVEPAAGGDGDRGGDQP